MYDVHVLDTTKFQVFSCSATFVYPFSILHACMYDRSAASCPKEDRPVEIRRLDHAALLVKDVERSRHFYGQVLGMEEVPRPSNFTFPGAWFRKERAEIHLIGERSEERRVGKECRS